MLYVISGPSGCGKSSIAKRMDFLHRPVSCTTRDKRIGEVDGVDYHFLPKSRFEQWVKEDLFIEHASVFSDYYGTLWSEIASYAHQDVLLEIDWQGFYAIKQKIPEVVGIFIMPPSLEELKKRLIHRKDPMYSVEKRLKCAQFETGCHLSYDYVVVNENLERSVEIVKSIFKVSAHLAHLYRMKNIPLCK